MARSDQAAWVFAGDAPGVWWVVHAQPPRFAARLLSAEEFAAEPRFAAFVPHGINVPVPVHFSLGADVLVVTDFLDPVELDETASPQKAILTPLMIEALHACQEAIDHVAARDPAFAPLAERAEQFLVGWQVQKVDPLTFDLQHASGAWVRARLDGDGGCETELRMMPREAARQGWSETLLRERLERVAGERALLIGDDWWKLDADAGSALAVDVFSVLARQDRRRLSWVAVSLETVPGEAPVRYAALHVGGPIPLTCRTEVEIDGKSPLMKGPVAFSADDAEAVLALLPAYGFTAAVNLLAAFHFAWFHEDIVDVPGKRREAPLPRVPCEVELVTGGELYAAVAFAAADARGMFRLVVAPHAPSSPDLGIDPAALLPFECAQLRREQFHVPAYLAER